MHRRRYVPFFDDCSQLIQLMGSAPSPTVIVVGPSDKNDKRVGVQGVTSCDATPVNEQVCDLSLSLSRARARARSLAPFTLSLCVALGCV
eukprot:COSAG03_NODE_408_length_8168_cov_31.509233_5_plen_90_part_00